MTNLLTSLNTGFYFAISKKDFENYLKSEKLNEFYPVIERQRKLSDLEREVKKLEETIEAFEKLDKDLANVYRTKLGQVQTEYLALQETMFFKSHDEIKLYFYSIIKNAFDGYKKRVEDKILVIQKATGRGVA